MEVYHDYEAARHVQRKSLLALEKLSYRKYGEKFVEDFNRTIQQLNGNVAYFIVGAFEIVSRVESAAAVAN